MFIIIINFFLNICYVSVPLQSFSAHWRSQNTYVQYIGDIKGWDMGGAEKKAKNATKIFSIYT